MNRISLGRLRTGSGALLLLDEAATGLWVHGALDRDSGFVDLALTGPDAAEAAKRFDHDWDPERIHDVPSEDADKLAERFIAESVRANLDASIRQVDPEPFPSRLERALARGGGGIAFHGHWAVAAGGLPNDVEIELFAEPMGEGPDGGRWRRLVLEIAPGAVAARSETIAQVMTDSGRLMFGDPEVIKSWQHEESLDGRGDCVFWGRDARVAADALNAVDLEPRRFGWVNLPVDEAANLAQKVAAERNERGLSLSVDYRPHSHHFVIMERIRESSDGAASLELAGANVLVVDATWGDSVFPVLRDLDAEGRTLRLRIELAPDEAPTVH